MDVLLNDLRFALRSLRKRPGFALVAIVTLALGIGATTAIFSAVNAVLLRPLPYPDADRIVMLWGTLGQKQSPVLAAYKDLMDYRARSRSFDEIGVMRGMSVNLTGTDTPDRLIGMFASSDVFHILGARVELGRTFNAAESDPNTMSSVAVISDALWRTRFGSDPAILGRTLVLNARPHTVIGVLSPDFHSPQNDYEVWLPLSSIPTRQTFDRGNQNVWGVARLRAGVSIAAARADLNRIAADLAREYPNTNSQFGASVVPLREQIVGTMGTSLLTIFAAVGLLLLIACANVANLQLARTATRAHEIALRTALGAARGRIVRQLLTENMVLAVVGGALGVVLAQWIASGLVTLVPGGLPGTGQAGLDATVLSFALATSMGTALMFGLAPALRASRGDLRGSLGVRAAAGAATGKGGAWITAGELALCTTLLIVAGLLTRSLSRLRGVDPGFDAQRILYTEFRLPTAQYGNDTLQAQFFARLAPALRAMPGAQSAALVSFAPMTGNFALLTYEVEGNPKPLSAQPQTYLSPASEGYFRTMGIPLIAGREIQATDRFGSPPVVVVSQTFAEREWPHAPAIGRRVRLQGDSVWRTVVGVVRDVKERSLSESATAHVYPALLQMPGNFCTIVVRTAAGDPTALANDLRHAVWSVDRNLPMWRITPMSRFVIAATMQQRFTAILTVAFSVLALVLGAVGVYGVMSHAVAQRTREMGVRVALGAPASRVRGMIVGRIVRVSVAAVIAGLIVAAVAARALTSQLFGVSPYDPLTFAAVPLLLIGVAALAAFVPALRASRVDPLVALRAE